MIVHIRGWGGEGIFLPPDPQFVIRDGAFSSSEHLLYMYVD